MRNHEHGGCWRGLAILCVSILLSGPVLGAPAWPDLSNPPKSAGKPGAADAAVVVAIEHYAELAPVRGAASNGEAWFNWFARGRSVPLARSRFLQDKEARDLDILDAAREAAGLVGEGGTLWFVFVGHGAADRDGTDGLLVGYDAPADIDGLAARSVPRSSLVRALEGPNPGHHHVALVLDACFSGQGSDGRPLVAGLQGTFRNVRALGAGGSSTTMLLAAGPGQYAGRLPGEERPAFSYLVLGALRGWGDRAEGGDGDGQVTLKEAGRYAAVALRSLVRDRAQDPVLVGPDRVVGPGKEDGPDLVAMVIRQGSTNPTRSRPERGEGGEAGASMREAAARDAEARKMEDEARRAREEADRLAWAGVSREEARIRKQRSREFEEDIAPYLTEDAGDGVVAEARAWLSGVDGEKARFGGKERKVEVPEAERVRQWLRGRGKSSSGSSSGRSSSKSSKATTPPPPTVSERVPKSFFRKGGDLFLRAGGRGFEQRSRQFGTTEARDLSHPLFADLGITTGFHVAFLRVIFDFGLLAAGSEDEEEGTDTREYGMETSVAVGADFDLGKAVGYAAWGLGVNSFGALPTGPIGGFEYQASTGLRIGFRLAGYLHPTMFGFSAGISVGISSRSEL